jgi:DNA-binding protein YbaB
MTAVATAGEDKARLDARAAELRVRVGDLLTDFEQRSTQLRDAQQAAAALTATKESADHKVRVGVDATGLLTDLHLDGASFDHGTPDELARAILELVRQAARQVRTQSADLLRPLTEGLPDLSDLTGSGPSLADALPKIPETSEPSDASGEPAPASRPASPDDDQSEFWLDR